MLNLPLKIYFPNGFLQIDSPDSKRINLPISQKSNALLLENPNLEVLYLHLDYLLSGEWKEVYITTSHPEDCLRNIASKFTSIEAAGGIIENEQAEVLFIFRRGKWDLPKGKIDDQETPEIAALREIEEETGAKELTLLSKLCCTYHVYNMFGDNVLKTTHWFLLHSNIHQDLTPQSEEDISAIKWFRKNELELPLSNSFPTITDLVEVYLTSEANQPKP